MSYFSRKVDDTQFEDTPAAAPGNSELTMKIDVVPIPTVSGAVDLQMKQRQNEAIPKIEKVGKDLFAANKTVLNSEGGKRLYRTSDLYNPVLSLEELIPMLTKNNLTLRLNAIREGTHAHTTCMELKTGVLFDMTKQAADSSNEKTTEVALKSAPDAGRIFVGVKCRKGNHYLQKLDYEVAPSFDDKQHLRA